MLTFLHAALIAAALGLSSTTAPPAGLAQAPAQAQPAPDIIAEIRGLIAKDEFVRAEVAVRAYAKEKGWTPEGLEAISWIARGNLAADRRDDALKFAYETERLALAALEKRTLDAEPRLPIALGAALEVQAQVLGLQGKRTEGVRLLERNLEEFGKTSIRARLIKNINLLSLEGQPAPAYATAEFIGARPPSIAELKGKPVILFFWAHWCPDCKAMAPVLAELQAAYKDAGLTIVAPTQRYGYVAKRAPAAPASEMTYIAEVLKEFYGSVPMTVPVSAESFANYGSSTTPTVVVVDRQGVVRLYHPGRMTRAELEPHIKAIVGSASAEQ